MALNSNTYQKVVLEEEKGCEPAMAMWQYYPLARFIILVTVDKSFFFSSSTYFIAGRKAQLNQYKEVTHSYKSS